MKYNILLTIFTLLGGIRLFAADIKPLKIKFLNGSSIVIPIQREQTVESLRDDVLEKSSNRIPLQSFKFIYKGREIMILNDEVKLTRIKDIPGLWESRNLEINGIFFSLPSRINHEN